ncbi:hypothetical protein [Acetonema longum]|uniref:Uncharacterized protein n=1 Tax=Acetonema longum DSM 6540 TaxID=1009370 RepID=F7NN12_9FIRM|nr:hypothetical protein [Acetonema longum]EGO62590.1 hypothetical protein ALO_17476 [Acetonema longum DSM 6540]
MESNRHKQAQELLLSIIDNGGEGYAARFQMLVSLAKRYEHDETARLIIDEAVRAAERLKFPQEEIDIFKELFMCRQMTRRMIAENHFMTVRTVWNKQKDFFTRIMPLVFGIDGIPFEKGKLYAED